jgi:hypothetical protein
LSPTYGRDLDTERGPTHDSSRYVQEGTMNGFVVVFAAFAIYAAAFGIANAVFGDSSLAGPAGGLLGTVVLVGLMKARDDKNE